MTQAEVIVQYRIELREFLIMVDLEDQRRCKWFRIRAGHRFKPSSSTKSWSVRRVIFFARFSKKLFYSLVNALQLIDCNEGIEKGAQPVYYIANIDYWFTRLE